MWWLARKEALSLVLEVNRLVSREDAGMRALREPLNTIIPGLMVI